MYGWLAGSIGILIIIFGFKIKFTMFELIQFIPIMTTYSLLPDIDHKLSWITWGSMMLTYSLSLVGYFFHLQNYFLFNYFLLGIIMLGANVLKHRGIAHTLWFVLITPVIILFLGMSIPYFIIALISCYTHLVCDGIPFKIK
jgi:hypothetical protein